jgi:hypothetical protein
MRWSLSICSHEGRNVSRGRAVVCRRRSLSMDGRRGRSRLAFRAHQGEHVRSALLAMLFVEPLQFGKHRFVKALRTWILPAELLDDRERFTDRVGESFLRGLSTECAYGFPRQINFGTSPMCHHLSSRTARAIEGLAIVRAPADPG